MRLFQPISGHITINGIDLNSIDIHSLFSWCDQECIIFSGTVLENVRAASMRMCGSVPPWNA